MQAALGKGGAAKIFRVVDAASGTELALKQLHTNAAEKLRELFEREYQTLASFDHPNTVKVYEFGHDRFGPFYTMELLEGEDLGGCAPLPWRTACRYLADAAQALSVLHARGLIHRDVSPRNLWRTANDRVKLLDFGALARFGTTQNVIGTPPCVPPEAFVRGGMDQRADLYALGAVAYFLLTGEHAYPARELSELHTYWRTTPVLPSLYVAHLAEMGRKDLEAVPKELDTLVLSLLQQSPAARPSSSAELLDRLHSLLGQTHDTDIEAAQARFTNTMFVGRNVELGRLRRQLDSALAGRAQLAVVEGPAGCGATRLLDELASQARVEHVTVVEIDAVREPGSYGVAGALALALLDALPERAEAAAREHASILAHIPRLQERLAAEPAVIPPVAGELRARLQQALCAFVRTLAQTNRILLVIDGLGQVDEESAAVVHRLVLEAREARLMIGCALLREAGTEPRLVDRAIAKLGEVIALGPLDEVDATALLESVFGRAELLTRLAARLYKVTRGNPGQTLALCRQLLQQGAINFVNGTWLLPSELNDADLHASLKASQLTRLAGLSDSARELLGVLSVHKGPLSQELVQQLAGPALAGQLPELLSREILISSGSSLVFVNEELRVSCERELSGDAERRARTTVAEYVLSQSSATSPERAQAGLHLLAAGDARGAEVIVSAAKSCVLEEVDRLISTTQTFETALRLFREQGRSVAEQVVLLATLARAGYEVDPRYSIEYGEQAVRALQDLLGLNRARTLQRYMGRHVAVMTSLARAGAELFAKRKNPCIPGLETAIQLLVVSVFATAATRATFFDPEGADSVIEALEPFTALGANNAAAFMYKYSRLIADTARDRLPDAAKRWQEILDRIATGKPLQGAPEELFTVCRGGALYARGSIIVNRDDPEALRTADLLEHNGYALNSAYAAQIRTMYYGLHGMSAEYERSKERVEQLAIAHGTSWQTEVWMPGPLSAISQHLHDALGVKRAAEQMKRLSATAPSLRVHARLMQGAYLLMRGRAAESIPWLEDCLHEAPHSRPAWGRSHGVLARAYNRTKQHAKARAACMRVVECYEDEAYDFPALNLIVLTELAIAEASLGDLSAAHARVEGMLSRLRVHQNPLTLGHIYETQVEIALIAGDTNEARAHFARMLEQYEIVNSPSLVQHCDVLRARIDELAGDVPAAKIASRLRTSMSTGSVSSNLTLLTDQLQASRGRSLRERAATALRVIAASTRAAQGALAFLDGEETLSIVATLDGNAASPELQAWMSQRMEHELNDPDTIVSDGAAADHAVASFRENNLDYRLTLLTQAAVSGPSLIGVAALGGEHGAPPACSRELVRLVCDLLSETPSGSEQN